MKKHTLFSLLVVLLLTSCASQIPSAGGNESGTEPASPSANEAGAEATSVPTATEAISAAPTFDNLCPAAKDGFNPHVSEADGYCLLYPADAVVVPQRFIVINPASATADTLGDAWVDIQVESASGRSAAQVADAKIAEAGEGIGVTRSEILLGGEQAIVVDGLPAPDSWRVVFAVHNDRLYTLTFQPWFPSNDPNQPTPLETLYATIVDTLRFMP
ncbi:MAG: hypothetical protein KPEEDBHJ_01185 [Anaerolineales bacterium]|nr:hypothetical protein [Anaerolineales bacterium]